jgi:integrase
MPGNLYRRGETWWGRITVAGREYRRSLRTSDRAEAKRRLARWLEEIRRSSFYGAARLSWKAAVTRYVSEVMAGAVKPSTGRRYLVSFRQVDPVLGGLYADEITRKVLADLISARKRQGATNATINRDLTAISAVLGACIDWGACEENPARAVSRKKLTRERREPIRPPTDEEIERLCAAVPPMVARLVRFLLQTGMRQEEAVSLEWSQVSLGRREVTLYRTKTSRPRVVSLTEAAVGTLLGTPRYIGSPYVFWHGEGRRYLNFPTWFVKLRNRAGVRFRCHDLRHRYAVDWLKAGGDIYALSRQLGHSSVSTTEIYLGHVGTNHGTGATVREADRGGPAG